MRTQTSKLFADLHDPARPFAISRVPPQTLGDLIRLIEHREGRDHQLAMMKAAAGHVVEYFAKDTDQIPISDLLDLRPRLKLYLEDRRYKRNAVRSYTNYLRILIRKAKEFGWSLCSPELEKSWREIVNAVKGTRSRRIVDYAIRKGKTPAEFTDGDLTNWSAEELKLGHQYEYVRHVKTTFGNRVAQAGLRGCLPLLTIQSRQNYGVPMHKLPEPMRSELAAVLDWKTAKFAVGRSNKSRHRPITALHLRRFVCRIYGFCHSILGKEVKTLRSLLSEEYVGRLTEWCVNHRKVGTPSLASWLGMIPPLGAHAALKGADLSYVRKLVDALPADPEGRIRERKSLKWVDFGVLEQIPNKIREHAAIVKSPKQKAILMRDALIVNWLLIQPWRQRNLREARLGTSDAGANVFFDEIPPLSTMDMPPWAEGVLKTNLHEKLWQFHFPADETKTGRAVHGIIPRPLIKPLEEYLTQYRPLLTMEGPPKTLFLNDHGRPYTKARFTSFVAGITLRHTGRRVTPHLFRDLFAVAFLKLYPEAYLSLSRILWHRNPNSTLQKYGRPFDESFGTRRAEEFWEKRQQMRAPEIKKLDP